MKKEKWYVFIAKGMGITPFRSMVKDSLLKKKPLNAILFHFAASNDELLFSDVFNESDRNAGIVYVPLLDKQETFSIELLKKYMPKIEDKRYYLAGSETFVNETRERLLTVGIDEEEIITDAFSGY